MTSMPISFVVWFLLGIALAIATPSFPEQLDPVHQKDAAAGRESAHMGISMRYNLLKQQAKDIKADTTLSTEERKQTLHRVQHQVARLLHHATGVPMVMLKRLPNPTADALRQQFLRKVDEILSSTTESDGQKRAAIGLAQTLYRQGLEAAGPGSNSDRERARPPNGEEGLRQIGSQIKGNIKTTMEGVVKSMKGPKKAKKRVQKERDNQQALS